MTRQFRSPLFPISAVILVVAALLVYALPDSSRGADDEQSPIEVHEFSVWVVDATLDKANSRENFPNTLPAAVNTSRGRMAGGGKQKISPFSLITTRGKDATNVELELRVVGGRFLGHWPPTDAKSGKLRWLEMNMTAEPPQEGRSMQLQKDSWLHGARELGAQHIQHMRRTEPFLTYDVEFGMTVPFKVEGGPDTYQISSLVNYPLYDIVISIPTPQGRRIGWLAELPANPKAANAPAPAAAAANPAPEGGNAVAQGVAVAVVGNFIRAIAPGGGGPATEPTMSTTPVIPQIEPGPPVDITVTAPLAKDSAELAAERQKMVDLITKLGLDAKEAELMVNRCGEWIFQGEELLLAYRLPANELESRVAMEVYPPPKKQVRVAYVIARNLNPQVKLEVESLIANLGSVNFTEREAAEERLKGLGKLSIPALKEALKNPDLEVVFRAERILVSLGEALQ